MPARTQRWIVLAALAAACTRTGSPPPSPAPGASGPPAAGGPPPIDGVTPLPSPLPDVVARVNGQQVLLRNVRILARQAKQGGKVTEPFAYRQAMQQFIVRELLFQEALSRKVSADERRLEQAYDEARLPYKDEAAWAAFLAQQGMDPATFRTELRVRHTVQALFEQEAGRDQSPVSDQEALAFYQSNPAMFDSGERLRARHILVRVPADVAADRKASFRAKAEGLLARIRKGEDFAALARKFSEDPGSAAKGGQLDDFARGQMVEPFEKAAYALQPGQVSDVVESPFGFHIIQLLERVPAQKLAFEQVKDALKRRLAQQRQQQALQNLVNSLRARAKIETYL